MGLADTSLVTAKSRCQYIDYSVYLSLQDLQSFVERMNRLERPISIDLDFLTPYKAHNKEQQTSDLHMV
jgi:hypothetical protein